MLGVQLRQKMKQTADETKERNAKTLKKIKQAAEKIAAGVPTYADNAAAFLQAIGNQ